MTTNVIQNDTCIVGCKIRQSLEWAGRKHSYLSPFSPLNFADCYLLLIFTIFYIYGWFCYCDGIMLNLEFCAS